MAPPPLIYLGGIVLGALLERWWRWEIPVAGWGRGMAAMLVGAAIILVAFALREFKRAGTSPKPHKPTQAIVTSGPFRFTRNPIYVSFTLVQAAIALAAASGWILALLAPVLLVVRYGVIAREERYLERKFGDEYTKYRRTARRWL